MLDGRLSQRGTQTSDMARRDRRAYDGGSPYDYGRPRKSAGRRRWRGHGFGYVLLSWAAVICMCGFIYWMSSRTGHDLGHGSDLIAQARRLLVWVARRLVGHEVDVSPIGHAAEFLVLGILLANAVSLHLGMPATIALSVAAASLWGASDEYHQLFVPQRSCDPADWLVDTVAALAGVLFVALFFGGSKRRRDH